MLFDGCLYVQDGSEIWVKPMVEEKVRALIHPAEYHDGPVEVLLNDKMLRWKGSAWLGEG